MAAAPSKQGIGKPSAARETQTPETTVSAADLALLRSLTAKIQELTEAELARGPLPVSSASDAPDSPDPPGSPGSTDPALMQAPRTAVARRVAPLPPACAPAGAAPLMSSEASPAAVAPLLDSTQTVRALTPTELTDIEASRWFAIELMLSAQQIDAAEVPDLDIFDVYRLYSVTSPDQGRVIHALRLGFFSSEVAAQSVARYLAAYFPTPTIRRVSIAEHERFAERLVTAGKDIGASGMHAFIELAATPAPRAQPHNAKRPAPNTKPPRRMAGLLWSRPSKSPGSTDR